MDKLVEIKKFVPLRALLKKREVRQSLTLLAVFGKDGNEVIFGTSDDLVYGFGHNRNGCLGLGVWDQDITQPTLNKHLSGKRLANIYYGFGHCIGLTATGHLYGWGDNEFGQLGVGCIEPFHTPQPMVALADKMVVKVCCGNSHTLVLTSEGLVYGFGRNSFGQLGDNTILMRCTPTHVAIYETVDDISCGKCHSLAVSHNGQLYVWGSNDCGQLGRQTDVDPTQHLKKPFSKRPIRVEIKFPIKKAVCGPNHTLALTSEGYIYGFGANDSGQVGNGCLVSQPTPVRINSRIMFKDIIANYDNTISMAISYDNKYFIWGFASDTNPKKKISIPYQLTELMENYSTYDIYSRYTKVPKTYQTMQFRRMLEPDNPMANFQPTITTVDHQTNEPIASNDSEEYYEDLDSTADHQSMSPYNSEANQLLLDMTDSFDSYYVKPTPVQPTIGVNSQMSSHHLETDSLIGFDDDYLQPNLTPQMDNKCTTTSNRFVVSEGIDVNEFTDLQNEDSTQQSDNTDQLNTPEDYSYPGTSVESMALNYSNANDCYDSNEFLESNVNCSSNGQLNQQPIGLPSADCDLSTGIESMHLQSQPLAAEDVCNSDTERVLRELYKKVLTKSFDNSNDSDLKIVIKNKAIYCHKTVLKIRNKKLWQTYVQNSSNDIQSEITIDTYTYKSFHTFLEYLYGISPEINDKNVTELLRLAENFDEQELKRLCAKSVHNDSDVLINLANVCLLYETAIQLNLKPIENACLKFTANHWKDILMCDEFQAMNDSNSKKMMSYAFSK